ncbi:hypothetical protein V5799_018522 [Amblyomma americanum]|uniref:Uncharacterized protein n=1 Tax=Amblyomma americanum TaxID=6943 RepID=A0AAQ4EZ80_AMBAM
MSSEEQANGDRDGERSSRMDFGAPRYQEERAPPPIVLRALLRAHLQPRQNVLYHVIEDYVILEGFQPFPVNQGCDMRSMALDASPPSVQGSSAALPAAPDSATDLVPDPNTTQEASSGQAPISKRRGRR